MVPLHRFLRITCHPKATRTYLSFKGMILRLRRVLRLRREKYGKTLAVFRCYDLSANPGGGGALPSNRLMGMCRWMGSHFHDWIDYNGVAFSIELLEWGRIFSGLGGKNILYVK